MKILFVDDEEKILASIERVFIDSEVEILTACNAEEALVLFDGNVIAAIISDNQMPGMQGIELLAKVKELSPDTVRILMTAYADLPTALDAINRGEVFRFVVKPWDNDSLINIVQEARDRFHIVRSLRHPDESTLLSLAQTIELKDPYTRGHCNTVAQYALLIAEALRLPEEMRLYIKQGSWLHDCGKIGVPEAILNKEGPLTDEEFGIIQKHPGWGAEVAQQARLHQMIVNIIQYHHEKMNGKGYPVGLQGMDIPLEARIVAVADVFDALTSDRPYRKGYSAEEAFRILSAMKDGNLDPELVDLFLTLDWRNVLSDNKNRC